MSEHYKAVSTHNPSVYDKILQIIHRVLYDLKKYFLLLLICILIPAGILIYFNYQKSKVYKATFTVTYEELVRKIYGDRINKLNTLLAESPKQAKSILGVDNQTINAFKGIDGMNILGDDLASDMSVEKIPFIVNIYVTDTTAIPTIQKSVVKFLEESNSYLIEKKALRIKEVTDELAFINNQLNMLDTLKRKYNSSPSASTKENKTADEFGGIYELSYDLYKRKMELEKKISLPKNLYVIDDALVPVSNNRSYILVGIIGAIVGFMIYLVLVYFIIPAIKLNR